MLAARVHRASGVRAFSQDSSSDVQDAGVPKVCVSRRQAAPTFSLHQQQQQPKTGSFGARNELWVKAEGSVQQEHFVASDAIECAYARSHAFCVSFVHK